MICLVFQRLRILDNIFLDDITLKQELDEAELNAFIS